MLPAAQFEDLVVEALDSLPPFFQAQMDNVVILVETWPSRRTLREMGVPAGQTLLGLYRGIPLTERTHAYNLVTPDTITLYQGPIEAMAREGQAGTLLDRVRDEGCKFDGQGIVDAQQHAGAVRLEGVGGGVAGAYAKLLLLAQARDILEGARCRIPGIGRAGAVENRPRRHRIPAWSGCGTPRPRRDGPSRDTGRPRVGPWSATTRTCATSTT